jgi:hypothetical protein
VCGDILIAKDPEALPPGAKRVETASLVIQAYAQSEPHYDQFLDQFIVEKNQMLENAEELRIELDTVIGQAAASGSIPIRSFTARSSCLHRSIARSFELRHAP